MNRTLRISIIVVISFLTYYVIFEYFGKIFAAIDTLLTFPIGSYFLTYIIAGIPIFIGTAIIHRDFNIFSYLGLKGNFISAFLLTFIFTLPMFLGGLTFFSLNYEITLPAILKLTIFAGLFEELYFRGFLFGQLFKFTKIGFIPSIFLGALLFASGHLYQSTEFSVLLGVFLTTFMGAIFFAWLYVEWNYNLWVPIFMHFFMNLSWALFTVSENALGGVKSNIFRGLTIALAIAATVIYKKRKKMKLEVNKKTLWWKGHKKESSALCQAN
ncbi:MAG: type II CAAX endopeptidase family protein [Bacteroidetes bacterium]|nr:type II CAAX endopeptidase family protein [Bacteroidota bacterium]